MTTVEPTPTPPPRPSGTPDASGPATWIWATVIVVLTVATFAGGMVALFGGADPVPTNAAQEVAAVDVAGDWVPYYDPEIPPHDDPALGMVPPTLIGESFDGETVVEVVPGDGRPKMVMFVTHWCPFCQDEVTALAPFFADYDVPDTVDVVVVNTYTDATRENYPPSAWFARHAWPFDTVPVMVDDELSNASESWGIPSFPYKVLIDADGRIVARSVGGAIDVAALMPELIEGLAGSVAG